MKNNRKFFVSFQIILLISIFSVLSAQDIKINEILYDPDENETSNEWIELFNTDFVSVNLKNWRIEWGGSSFSYRHFTIEESITIEPNQFILIGDTDVINVDITASNLSFQNVTAETDGVRIVSALGDTIDTILYGSPNSNELPGDANQPGIHFAPNVSSGHSLVRFPDGADTDNCENDFFECINPTPGQPNFLEQDLEIHSISIFPTHPDTTEEVYLSFEIKNNSNICVQPDSCHYEIILSDSAFFHSVIQDTINAGEILTFEQNLGIFQTDFCELSVQIFLSNDLNQENNLLTTSFLVGKSPIIINEIMFAPNTSNVEWVEIYNRSAENYSLKNWRIKDAGMPWNIIETDKIIPANSYGIISEDTSAVKNYYGGDIILFQTNDWSSLNNTTPDEVHFGDNYSTQLDSVYYDPTEISVPNNFSLERINPFEDISENWGVSIDSCGATPGKVNSITPKEYDLCASFFGKEINGDFIKLLGTCSNIGFNDVEEGQAIFFDDSNFNSQYDVGEEIETQSFPLAAEQSEEFSYTIEISEGNYYHFGFLISATLDLDASNNLIFTTYNSYENYPVATNEIMHSPENGPEWLELYNNFDYEINLNGWQVADASNSIGITADIFLSSNEFLILTANISDFIEQFPDVDCEIVNYLPSLNNTDDEIALYDNYNTLIDSLHYYSDWGEDENNSLERINPDMSSNNQNNWESSLDNFGATPGRENSLYIEMIAPQVELSITPNPVSLREKNSVLIEFNLPEVLSKVNIRIFDMKGRMVRWVSEQILTASEGAIIWNCKNDNGKIVPTGIYIVHLEAAGKQSGRVFRKIETMVIGEK